MWKYKNVEIYQYSLLNIITSLSKTYLTEKLKSSIKRALTLKIK